MYKKRFDFTTCILILLIVFEMLIIAFVVYKNVQNTNNSVQKLSTSGKVTVKDLNGVVYDYAGENIQILEENGEVYVEVTIPFDTRCSCFNED